jgi:hypothetical protein
MLSLAGRARFASLLAVACALLITGAAAGAAGSALILGENNDSGTSQTVLTNAGLGAAFTLKTTNVATNATGIFGWTSSTGANATRGVYGKADGPNSYGVFGRQSGVAGNGAAVYAEGNNNAGVIATSSESDAVVGIAGCTGFCGANGLDGTGDGLGAGVFGDGANSIAGVQASEGFVSAVYATSFTEDIPAVYADSSIGTGVQAYGEFGGSPSITTSAGGSFLGFNGVYGQTDSGFGAGVYARSNGGLNFALFAQGNAHVTGNFSVDGTCTGCTAGAVAVNGSGSTLKQGDAVALEGVAQAKDGSIVLTVRAAKKGDAVIGVVDRALKAAPESMQIRGEKRTINVNKEGEKEIAAKTRTVKAPKGLWEEGGTSVAADAYLRIITSGVFAFDGAAPADAEVGDALAVGGSNGKLGKAAADSSAKAGRYLGKLKDGRVVLMVSPS